MKLAIVRYFDLAPSIDNIGRALNCMCLRYAARDECDHTVIQNLQTDENIDVGVCYGVIYFSFMRSVHPFVG